MRLSSLRWPLRLRNQSLRSIPSVQLAKVLAGLRKADIGDTFLEKNQVATLMAALLEGSELEELDIR